MVARTNNNYDAHGGLPPISDEELLRQQKHNDPSELKRLAERERQDRHDVPIVVDGGKDVGMFVPLNEFRRRTGKSRISFHEFVRIIEDPKSGIDFDPDNNAIARGVVEYLEHDRVRHHHINNPRSDKYDDLKANVAIVSKYIEGMYFPNGRPHPNDPKVEQLDEIGEKAGSILKWAARRQLVLRAITFPIRIIQRIAGHDPDEGKTVAEIRFGKYGEPHVGAAKLYARLVKKQNGFGLDPRSWVGKRYNWQLPDKEDSIFNTQAVEIEQAIDQKEKQLGKQAPGDFLAIEGMAMAKVGAELAHIQDMPPQDVHKSVELAHEILDKLKRICVKKNGYALDSPDAQMRDLEEAQLILAFASKYEDVMAGLAQTNPAAALNDPQFVEARIAIGKLGFITMRNALKALADDPDGASKMHDLEKSMLSLPEEFQKTDGESVEKLLKVVENSMNYAAELQGIRVERKKGREQKHAARQEAEAFVNQVGQMMVSNVKILEANKWVDSCKQTMAEYHQAQSRAQQQQAIPEASLQR